MVVSNSVTTDALNSPTDPSSDSSVISMNDDSGNAEEYVSNIVNYYYYNYYFNYYNYYYYYDYYYY